MIWYILVYVIGFILSMFLIWYHDKDLSQKSSLGMALMLSLASWINIVAILLSLLVRSNFWKKLEDKWQGK